MWVTKLLISPEKKGFFAQKRPNLAQNWHFWSIWARPCRLIQCPVGGSVGGCGTHYGMVQFGPKLAFLSIAGSFGALLVGWLVVVERAVSRKTPIYFINY